MTTKNPEKQRQPTIAENQNIVMSGKVPKLNPKTDGFITFDIKLKGKSLHLQMRNSGSGLHTKEWIPMKDVLAILDKTKVTNQPFTSMIFKPLFNHGSANNVSFLAAILRCKELALIAAVPSKMYSHQMSVNYAENRKKILALASKS